MTVKPSKWRTTRPARWMAAPALVVVLLVMVLLLASCGAGTGSAGTGTVETITSAPADAAPADAAPADSTPADSVAATAAPAAAAAPLGGVRTFVIVPAESEARYRATEEFFAGALAKLGINAGFGEAVGTTKEIEGKLTLNLDSLSDALGENSFTVRMDTFVTGRDMRDNWIRTDGPRFNDFPLATFVATSIEGAPASYTEGEEVSFKLAGDLTIHEVTKPVTFDLTARMTGNTLTGKASTQVLLTDFGIEPPSFANTLTVNNEVGLEVDFTAREQ